MSEQPRDWDKEMAEIDRAMARQPGGAPVPAGRPVPPGPGAPPPAAPRRGSVAMTWLWVGLAVLLGAGLIVWPYPKACGLQLIFYLGATGFALIAALTGALASWRHRRGFAHILSLLVIALAAVVAARELLPRVGYAKETRAWACPGEPVTPAPRPAPAQPAPSTEPSR